MRQVVAMLWSDYKRRTLELSAMAVDDQSATKEAHPTLYHAPKVSAVSSRRTHAADCEEFLKTEGNSDTAFGLYINVDRGGGLDGQPSATMARIQETEDAAYSEPGRAVDLDKLCDANNIICSLESLSRLKEKHLVGRTGDLVEQLRHALVGARLVELLRPACAHGLVHDGGASADGTVGRDHMTMFARARGAHGHSSQFS